MTVRDAAAPGGEETLDEDAVRARFLADLAAAGISLPPGRAEAATDFLALHRQVRLVRAACAAQAPLPLGFAPAGT